MGFREKFHLLRPSSTTSADGDQTTKRRRRSLFNLVAPDQVTEQSLQVWRGLPAEIRHDPSMASFQMENERLRGSSVPTDDESILPDDAESSHEDDQSHEGSEFISMKRLRPRGAGERIPCEKSSEGDEQHSDHEIHEGPRKSKKRRQLERRLKKVGLLIFWFFAATVLISTNEKKLVQKTLAVPAEGSNTFVLPQNPLGDFKLKLFGTFNESAKLLNETDHFLTLQLQLVQRAEGPNGTDRIQDILRPWLIPIVDEDHFDTAPIVTTNHTFDMPTEILSLLRDHSSIRLKLSTNDATKDFAVRLVYDPLIVDVKTGTLLAALILSAFYALLVWEVFHRTFIAIICSMAAIAVLAVLGDRPTMEEIVVWMDMEMLTLLFAMMLLVGIMTETGVFDYVAVLAFEISGGKIWPLIYSLCIITCLVSSFLDNMTTVLLMTPVAIRLCEVMSLDPVPVLMGIIVHSNIGGSLTPIGDPISIIICSNHFIANSGVTFMEFVAHTIPGVILTVIQSCVYLRLVFWDIKSLRLNEPKEIKELRREIKVWQRTAYSLSSFSKDVDLVRETLLKKVKILKHKLKKKQAGVGSNDAYVHTLEDLKLKYPIKNKTLLIQSVSTLVFVIICFFIQSVPHLRTLPLGWVALLGVIALLIVLNRDDIEHMMHRIEWTTLLFFAAMFVMMECVERLGLITWIGEVTENIILFVDKRHRLAMAMFIILWISALASAILDSIPVTAMMVKVVVSLVAKESLGLPLEPLVWALAFGPCLGGNGTLYGASANVLSAGMAEQHGYKISFTRYLKIVFPMMLGQITIITAYLMVAHILFEWH